MSLYSRRYTSDGHAVWWINVQWKGYTRIRVSTGTHKKRDAQALLHTIKQLKAAGRRDLLGLIASKRLELRDVHGTAPRPAGDHATSSGAAESGSRFAGG